MQSLPWKLWALIALSSTLQVLMFPIAGPVPLWRSALGWVALAPFIVAILSEDGGRPLRMGQAALLGYACGLLWYLGNCYWIYQTMYLYGGLPKPMALGILVLFSLYLGLYHALFAAGMAWLRQGRLGVGGALLLMPFVWVAVELARARITSFPWDLLGYTQVDNGALTMLAPLGGVMLLSFVIAAVNAGFAAVWLVRKQGSRLRAGIAAAGAAVVLQFGALYHAPADPAAHHATLLQENLEVGAPGKTVEQLSNQQEYEQFTALTLAPEYLMEAGTPAQHWMDSGGGVPSADIVLWPEAPSDFFDTDPEFRKAMANTARQTHSPVIVEDVSPAPRGADGEDHLYNSARFINADGTFDGRYDKIHLVPFGEYVPYRRLFFFAGKLLANLPFLPGVARHPFVTGGHSYGTFICYEAVFGDEIRHFVLNGADVLVNISDDGWYGDTSAPWEHLNMARMRAIENRRWLLRDTNTGITTAIDPHGRGVFTTPRHVRAAFSFDFGYRTDKTLYTRFGDWFAWMCAGLTLGAGILLRKPGSESRR